MKRRARASAALLLAGLFVFDASPCSACSCVEPLQGHVERADMIFTGKVLEVHGWFGFNERTAQELLGIGSPIPYGDAVFQVEKAHKGYPRRQQWVVGAGPGASCGIEFQVGKTYTVFANHRHRYLETGLCHGTVEGEVDLADYGPSPKLTFAPEPFVVDGIGGIQPYGKARWALLALIVTSAVTAAVAIRYLMRAVRKLPFFK